MSMSGIAKHRSKLKLTWLGPYQIIEILGQNVYKLKDPLGKVTEAHSTRLRLYSGAKINMSEEVKKNFINNRGKFYLKKVVNLEFYDKEYQVACVWYGLEDLEPSWEPLSVIASTAPDPVMEYLRRNSNKEPEKTILNDFVKIVELGKAV